MVIDGGAIGAACPCAGLGVRRNRLNGPLAARGKPADRGARGKLPMGQPGLPTLLRTHSRTKTARAKSTHLAVTIPDPCPEKPARGGRGLTPADLVSPHEIWVLSKIEARCIGRQFLRKRRHT